MQMKLSQLLLIAISKAWMYKIHLQSSIQVRSEMASGFPGWLTCLIFYIYIYIVTLYHEGDSDSETIALTSDDESDDSVENEKF